jgi:hypothetical protein
VANSSNGPRLPDTCPGWLSGPRKIFVPLCEIFGAIVSLAGGCRTDLSLSAGTFTTALSLTAGARPRVDATT